MTKKALIVVNLAGFLCFLKNDFQLLHDLGFDIEIAADGRMPNGGRAVELSLLEKAKIPFHQINFDSKNPLSKANFTAYKELRRVIRNNDFDFISCHTPISGMLTRIAAQRERRIHGTRVIYTTHGFAFCRGASKKSWLMYYPVEFILSSLCDAIVTINREDFQNAKKMLCRKVYQLPGVGVDTERMKPRNFSYAEYRKTLGIRQKDIMVLSVGELSARKNHRVVIEALSLLPDKDRYQYIVCGRDVSGTGLEQELSDLAKKLDVRVKFLGHRTDIPEINNCADIAVIPSLREGLGLAGIEALASGVPVIGSNVQGIRDYVIPGKTGYLCNPYEPYQFAQAISCLSAMDGLTRERMSQYCREKAADFTLLRSKEKLSEIYQETLQTFEEGNRGYKLS